MIQAMRSADGRELDHLLGEQLAWSRAPTLTQGPALIFFMVR